MIRLRSQAITGAGTASNTFTPDLPAHEVGDVLVVAVSVDVGSVDITTSVAWTKVGTFAQSGGTRGGFFYRVATTNSETPPEFAGNNEEWCCVVQAWVGVDTTTPIDAESARVDWNNVSAITAGSVTTSTANCAIIHMICADGAAKGSPFALGDAILDASMFPETATTCSLSVAHTFQSAAGPNTPFTWRVIISNEGGNAWAIALRPADPSAGTGVRPNPSATYIEAGIAVNASQLYTTLEETNTGIASIDGVSLSSIVPNMTSQTALPPDNDTDQLSRVPQFADTTDATGGLLCGPSFSFAAIDLSNKSVAWNWRVVNAITPSIVGALNVLFVFQDSLGAWAAFRRPTVKVGLSTATNNRFCIVPQTATPDYSSGTIDWSTVVRFKMLVHRIAANQANIQIRGIAMYDQYGVRITGGSAAAPITMGSIFDVANNGTATQISTRQGAGQVILRQGLEIGDGGTTPTFFDAIGQSFELPPPYNPETRNFDYRVAAGFHGIKINPGAGDTVRLRAAVVSASQNAPFVFTGSASATVECEGLTVSGPWSPVCGAGLTIAGATFTACNQIIGSSATYNACLFRAPNGTHLITADDGAQFNSCNFRTDDPAKFAMEIDAAGTVSFDNCAFTGFTVDINVTATTGTVTLLLGDGQATPTHQTAGATVIIDAVVLSTTWTNEDLADGTSILVRNITTSTTIAYTASLATAAGYTISMVPGVDYTVGDIIEIRQSRKDGTNYFRPRTSTIITTSGGGSIIEAGALATCPVCDALGLDGEDYDSVFELDYIDDELDIETAGAWQTGQLMAWWEWEITKQTPMEDFWGAWEVQIDGSFRNNTSVLSSLIDTTETGDSIETTGRRIQRSDGARPIKSPTTGGGTVDLSWRDPVTVVATGSGLTTAQAAQLTSIDKKTKIIPALL